MARVQFLGIGRLERASSREARGYGRPEARSNCCGNENETRLHGARARRHKRVVRGLEINGGLSSRRGTGKDVACWAQG